QNEQQSFIPLSSKLHLEHILPQTTNEFWNNIFTIEQREIWTNSLANLVLLSLRKNIQAQNYDFNSKKEAYFNNDNVVTSFHTTRDIKEICEWNEKELKLRKDKLVNKINEIISIFNRREF
ncbi:MAG: HNH endonuclease family protein, partial [Aliarcobacter cryaerophilus]|nr:HNH endonuclease family protein [Aliarcobacter cryaerophilus]